MMKDERKNESTGKETGVKMEAKIINQEPTIHKRTTLKAEGTTTTEEMTDSSGMETRMTEAVGVGIR